MTKLELIKYLTSEIIRNDKIRTDNRKNQELDESDKMYFEGYIDGLQHALGELKRLSFKNKDKDNG